VLPSWLYFALNGAMLVLFGMFAWCSVSLGLRSSNLTYRGIVDRGLYGVVRHPAYATKNMAWWVGALPFILIEFYGSVSRGLFAVLSMAVWSGVYVARAITEERHLLSVNGEYAKYAARVPWRFIPGVV
jgi:protein-S-isoprenylcysteine O-methyltransferase Ste14